MWFQTMIQLSNSNLVLLLLLCSGFAGYIQFIPHARVPVLQYVSNRYGISCDISINNFAGRIKSKIFYWVNTLDERFSDMVLLVWIELAKVFAATFFLVSWMLSIIFPSRSRNGQKLKKLMIQRVGPSTPIPFAYLSSFIFRYYFLCQYLSLFLTYLWFTKCLAYSCTFYIEFFRHWSHQFYHLWRRFMKGTLQKILQVKWNLLCIWILSSIIACQR